MLTVEELRDFLSDKPDDMPVLVWDSDRGVPVRPEYPTVEKVVPSEMDDELFDISPVGQKVIVI